MYRKSQPQEVLETSTTVQPSASPSALLRDDQFYVIFKQSTNNGESFAISGNKYNPQKIVINPNELSAIMDRRDSYPWLNSFLADEATAEFPEYNKKEKAKTVILSSAKLSASSLVLYHNSSKVGIFEAYETNFQQSKLVIYNFQTNEVIAAVNRPYSGRYMQYIDFNEKTNEVFCFLPEYDPNISSDIGHIKQILAVNLATGKIIKTFPVPYTDYLKVNQQIAYDAQSRRLLIDSSDSENKGGLYSIDLLSGSTTKIADWPLSMVHNSYSDGKVLLFNSEENIYQPYYIRRNYLSNAKIKIPVSENGIDSIKLVQFTPSLYRYVFQGTSKDNKTCYWIRDWMNDGSDVHCFSDDVIPVFLSGPRDEEDHFTEKNCASETEFYDEILKIHFTLPKCIQHARESGFYDNSFPPDLNRSHLFLWFNTQVLMNDFSHSEEYWFKYYFGSTSTGWYEKNPQVTKQNVQYGNRSGTMYTMNFHEGSDRYTIRRLFLPLNDKEILEITTSNDVSWPIAEEILKSMKFDE